MFKTASYATRWKGLAIAGVLAQVCVAFPVAARPEAAALYLPTMAIGAVAQRCDTSQAIVPARGPDQALPGGSTKAAAILQGAPSALDRIRMEQASLDDARSQNTPVAAVLIGISPNCPRIAPMQTALHLPATAPASRDAFLATDRVAIRRTSFTSQWNRVSSAGLSAQGVRERIGSAPSNDASMLQRVNRWVNRSILFGEDIAIWGKRDYWASARETLRLGRGDCEDLAILKYQMLAALGVKKQDMFLTLARDLARNADHAVLVVRHEGRFYMLDNSTDAILPANVSYDYRPIVSFSSDSAWLHGAIRRPAAPQLAYLSVSATSSPRVIGLSR